MSKPKSKNPIPHIKASDARALAQLATQATLGATQVVEGVHHSVLTSMGLPVGSEAGKTTGLTGLIYRTIQQVAHLVGQGFGSTLEKLEPLFDSLEHNPETPEREAFVAALNGVMGGRLVANHNPLATPMTLRFDGKPLHWDEPLAVPARNKILVLVHGLCMNDLQWCRQGLGPSVDYGADLAAALGFSALYLRYNTGLHTSQNGHEFSVQLSQLLAHWPCPIEEISFVVHSMGGLVTRAAIHYGRVRGERWPDRVKSVVFLGTPHHGAPLERLGNSFDGVLGSSLYSKPFTKLTALRSAGITDLRYGCVLDEDWSGEDRFAQGGDRRKATPLPEGVTCYAVAAVTSLERGAMADQLGDGLVPLSSALGQHPDPQFALGFAPENTWVGQGLNHLDLLSQPSISRKLVEWLGT